MLRFALLAILSTMSLTHVVAADMPPYSTIQKMPLIASDQGVQVRRDSGVVYIINTNDRAVTVAGGEVRWGDGQRGAAPLKGKVIDAGDIATVTNSGISAGTTCNNFFVTTR